MRSERVVCARMHPRRLCVDSSTTAPTCPAVSRCRDVSCATRRSRCRRRQRGTRSPRSPSPARTAAVRTPAHAPASPPPGPAVPDAPCHDGGTAAAIPRHSCQPGQLVHVVSDVPPRWALPALTELVLLDTGQEEHWAERQRSHSPWAYKEVCGAAGTCRFASHDTCPVADCTCQCRRRDSSVA